MGILSKITDEYFGVTIREEDMILKYSLDEKFTPRELTPEEKVFLNALADHILFLSKSLFFQIADLQQHTKLVLSNKHVEREEMPDKEKIERKMKTVESLIEENEKDLDQGELPKEDVSVLDILKAQWQELNNALNNPAYNKKTRALLGMYYHNENNSVVTLYVDAIEEEAKKDPYDTMLLMGQVLLHEYFHSFYAHVGVGSNKPIYYMEEAMAEYGSLAFLFSVAISRSSIAKQTHDAMIYAVDSFKKKRNRVGTSAVYGCGVYLFDYLCEFYREYIARYANMSCLLDSCERQWVEFKYMLYPKYPSSPIIENLLYERLMEML